MITLKQCFIVLFFFVLPVISYSQENPKGFIITYKNDTIYGEFQREFRKNSLNKCYFKAQNENSFQVYTPENIKVYKANQSNYFKSVINPELKEKVLVFYELIFDSENDLYYNRDINGEYFFITDTTNRLFLLKNSKREIYYDNVKHQKEYKEYIGVLKYLFKEKPELFSKIERVNLTQKSLIQFLESLNPKQKPVFIKNIEKSILKIGASIGLHHISIKKGYEFGDNLYFLNSSDFNTDNAIVPSITFDLKIPAIAKHLSLGYELSYSSFKLETTNYMHSNVDYLDYENTIQLSRSSLNNLLLIKYVLPYRTVKPAILLGGFANISIEDQYSRKLVMKWPSGQTYFEGEDTENPFNEIDYGFCFGVSLEKDLSNKISLYATSKYQTGVGLTHGLSSDYFAFKLGIFFANIKF